MPSVYMYTYMSGDTYAHIPHSHAHSTSEELKVPFCGESICMVWLHGRHLLSIHIIPYSIPSATKSVNQSVS